MSQQEICLPYRGDIRGLVAIGSELIWITRHREGAPTQIHRFDLASLEHRTVDPGGGGAAVATDGKTIWVADADGGLHSVSPKAKKPKRLATLPAPATRLTVFGGRVLALCGSVAVIGDAGDGKTRQIIELTGQATAAAVNPTGHWIAIGDDQGRVSVYENESATERGDDGFELSESSVIHTGPVTALSFEPDELRFLSTGRDLKLLSTHARGRLEPEDRGRTSMHGSPVAAIVWPNDERFITGAADKTCKTWARGAATQPATLSDGVGKVVDLAVVHHRRPHLAIACTDGSIRVFLLDAAGKFGGPTHRIDDAYAMAARQLSRADAQGRGEGLTNLRQYDDARSVDMLADHLKQETDHAVRRHAAEILAASKHPLAGKRLQSLLGHASETVQLIALDGLLDRSPPGDLQPLDDALSVGQAAVGVAAVQRLTPLAAGDENALARLTAALDHAVIGGSRRGSSRIGIGVSRRQPRGESVGTGRRGGRWSGVGADPAAPTRFDRSGSGPRGDSAGAGRRRRIGAADGVWRFGFGVPRPRRVDPGGRRSDAPAAF